MNNKNMTPVNDDFQYWNDEELRTEAKALSYVVFETASYESGDHKRLTLITEEIEKRGRECK